MAASRKFASKPHMAGSPGDLDTATEFLDILQRELGITASKEPIYPAGSVESRNATLSIPTSSELRAWVDVYYPILNTPLQRSLEILGDDGNPVWQANLEEEVDEADPDAFEHGNVVPAFHGLSANGEVEGKLVYAHYGRKQDYDALVDAGSSKTSSNSFRRILTQLLRCGLQRRNCHYAVRRTIPWTQGNLTWCIEFNISHTG